MGKKKPPNFVIIDDNISLNESQPNIDENTNNKADNDGFEIVTNKSHKKSIRQLSPTLKHTSTPISTPLTSVSTCSKTNTPNTTNTPNIINTPNLDKRVYISNFLHYNFHKINRYIPLTDIEYELMTSESEYEDDFYDY